MNRQIFIHIPKAAGNTLYSVFRDVYSTNQIYKLSMQPEAIARFRAHEPAALRNLRLVYGHVDWRVVDLIPDAACFTMLREPIGRVSSLYYYHRALPGDPGHALAMRFDLAQWMERGEVIEADNGMVRRLSGAIDAVPFGECTSEMLKRAKANLERMSLLGLTERFDESYALLCAVFGWAARPYERRNVNEQRPQSHARALHKAVERHNALDLELYEFGEKLFNRRLAELDIAVILEDLERRKHQRWSVWANTWVHKASYQIRRVLTRRGRYRAFG